MKGAFGCLAAFIGLEAAAAVVVVLVLLLLVVVVMLLVLVVLLLLPLLLLLILPYIIPSVVNVEQHGRFLLAGSRR